LRACGFLRLLRASITVTEGKQEETYNYTYLGYPVLKFDKTTHSYFLIDEDILIISFPGKNASVFQRQK
jgi:hypothetical protein